MPSIVSLICVIVMGICVIAMFVMLVWSLIERMWGFVFLFLFNMLFCGLVGLWNLSIYLSKIGQI